MTLQGGSQGSECPDLSLYVKMKVKLLSHVGLLGTPGTIACQAPPSVGFSRQEYWSGLPFPSPGDLPDQGIEPSLPHCRQTLLLSEPPGKSFLDHFWKVPFIYEKFLSPTKVHPPTVEIYLLFKVKNSLNLAG